LREGDAAVLTGSRSFLFRLFFLYRPWLFRFLCAWFTVLLSLTARRYGSTLSKGSNISLLLEVLLHAKASCFLVACRPPFLVLCAFTAYLYTSLSSCALRSFVLIWRVLPSSAHTLHSCHSFCVPPVAGCFGVREGKNWYSVL